MAFPTSPINGQQANINGITYTYSTSLTAWTVSTSVSNSFVSISVTGNVNSGNLLATGLASVTGNITANYFIGNGSQLSGLSASKIFNGTSEANIGASGGNANITIGGTSNVFVVASTGIYTTGLSSVSGNITSAANVNANNVIATTIVNAPSHTGTVISVTGNVTGGNLLTAGLISSTGTVTGSSFLGSVVSVTANITGGNILTGGLISSAGNVQVASFGVGTAASGTAGEIRATNNITAYYSDDRLKTKLGTIENALDKIDQLTGFYYEENDLAVALGYERKRQVGLSAQQMLGAMPEIVTSAPIDPDKYLTIWYEKTVPLLVEGIKELRRELNEIKQQLRG